MNLTANSCFQKYRLTANKNKIVLSIIFSSYKTMNNNEYIIKEYKHKVGV